MKRMKKIGILLLSALLIIGCLAGTANAAPTMELSDYFQIKVTSWTEGEATMRGIGGDITDWQTDVYGGQTAAASLVRKKDAPSTSVSAPAVTYTWKFVKDGTTTEVTGNTVKVPKEYSGGHVTVTAKTKGDRDWMDSFVREIINIR